MSVTMTTKRRLAVAAVTVAAGTGLAFTCLASTAHAAQVGRYVSLRLAYHPSQAADVADHSTANGARVIEWNWEGHTNQLWQAEYVDDGYYRFQNVHSGKCLNVEGGGTANLTHVIQWTCGYSANEQWRPVRKGDGYQLVARSSDKCLNVEGGVGEGRRLIQYTCSTDGQSNDDWLLSAEPAF
jgi:hypothetical protein